MSEPITGWSLSRRCNPPVAELRWLPETNVKNRLEGDYIWLKVAYQF